MKLIVGLGNPGKQYENNRHNIGFQVVDLLAERHNLRFEIKQGKAKAALGSMVVQVGVEHVGATEEPGALVITRPVFQTVRVVLGKPQTFMNLVGPSVVALLRFYKIAPADLLVIYDDLDLPLGTLRLRPSGGAGGHNGMKSIIQSVGSNEFARLRIGIDRPPGRMDPADYVLQDFSAAQEAALEQTRPEIVDACEHWLVNGITSAMNAYNSRSVAEQTQETAG